MAMAMAMAGAGAGLAHAFASQERPAAQHRESHFRMELEAVGLPAIAEGLCLEILAPGEQVARDGGLFKEIRDSGGAQLRGTKSLPLALASSKRFLSDIHRMPPLLRLKLPFSADFGNAKPSTDAPRRSSHGAPHAVAPHPRGP
jgi:hypothetical protein